MLETRWVKTWLLFLTHCLQWQTFGKKCFSRLLQMWLSPLTGGPTHLSVLVGTSPHICLERIKCLWSLYRDWVRTAVPGTETPFLSRALQDFPCTNTAVCPQTHSETVHETFLFPLALQPLAFNFQNEIFRFKIVQKNLWSRSGFILI
jgi:hypothetical protein